MLRFETWSVRALSALALAAIAACSGPEKTAGVDVIDGDVAFSNVSIVDVENGALIPGQTVVVSGQRISAIVPHADAALAEGIAMVDGTGRYLAPGLMDMHTHPVTPDDLAVALGHGVTSIRVMWGNPSHLEMRESVRAGEIPGPRMRLAGDLIDGEPPIWEEYGYPANAYTDPEAMDDMVAGQKAAGYDFVKTYTRLTPDVFDAILAAGQKHSIEVSGHVPQDMAIRDAIAGGMRTSEHFIGVVGAVWQDESLPNPDVSPFDSRAREFVVKVGEGEIDPDTLIDWDKVAELAEWVAAQQHWFVPTHDIMRNFTNDFQRPTPEMLQYMSADEQGLFEMIETGSFFKLTPMQKNGESKLYELRTQVLGAFHEAGVKIIAGTDHGRLSGLMLVDEIKALHKAGFSRAAAIRAATSEPGRYLGHAGGLGVVAEDAIADLVLLDANPLEDLDALHRVRGVMADGRWYSRDELDAVLNEIIERMAAAGD